MIVSPEQCRAARGFLAWSQQQLASAAGISRQTVADFESGKRKPIPTVMDSIRRALLNERISFIEPSDHYAGGVKLERAEALSFVKAPSPPSGEFRFYSGFEELALAED